MDFLNYQNSKVLKDLRCVYPWKLDLFFWIFYHWFIEQIDYHVIPQLSLYIFQLIFLSAARDRPWWSAGKRYRSDSTGHRYKVISVIFHYNFPQIPEINIIRKTCWLLGVGCVRTTCRSFELLGRNTRCVCELLPWFVASAKIIPKGCDLCVSCTLCSEVFRTTW